VRKAFLSSTVAATQQGWYSLCKLKLLNTIITLFYGAFAIRGLVGGALRYCHTFQLDPFLVANKTFLWIDWPFSFHSKFKTPKLKIAIITHHTQDKHTTQAPTGMVLAKRLSQQSTTSTSLFIHASSNMYHGNYSRVCISRKTRIWAQNT